MSVPPGIDHVIFLSLTELHFPIPVIISTSERAVGMRECWVQGYRCSWLVACVNSGSTCMRLSFAAARRPSVECFCVNR